MLLNLPYFDNNATTKPYTEVNDLINLYSEKYYANVSSKNHPLGWASNAAYKNLIESIAKILNTSVQNIIITSGATEAISLIIKGLYFQNKSEKNHIISCVTEHSAILETLSYLKKFHNANITLLNVDKFGKINLDELKEIITDKTLLVTLMAVNNETGVMHPIKEIYSITQQYRVLFFTDSTQYIGKLHLQNIYADIFCGSAHKFHGPKGIGFAVIKNIGTKVILHPLIHGGNQQAYRSGTIPLPLVAGMYEALRISMKDIEINQRNIQSIRNYFETQLTSSFDCIINSAPSERIFNTSSITFHQKYYNTLINLSKRYCFSQGSACSDGNGKPSHVLTSMGFSKEEIKNTFRFSFSQFNTLTEIDQFIIDLKKNYEQENH